jgi:hypothetical protein
MEDLLALAMESHGGQARWDAIHGVTAELSIGGALWEIKGKAGILRDAHYEADTHIQRATLGRFTAPDRRVRFTRDRLVLETDAGMVIETRNNPRSAFVGHTQESSWDDLHVAYFSGYAMWTLSIIGFNDVYLVRRPPLARRRTPKRARLLRSLGHAAHRPLAL